MDYLKAKAGLLSTLEKGKQLSEKLGFTTSAEAMDRMKTEVERKKLTIVTVGEMRRGKSSMLNALLNERNLFPVDISVCTNVVTIVRYGQKEHIEAVMVKYDAKGQAERFSQEITRDDIKQYVTEEHNANNHKNVEVLEMTIPNDLLKQGVVVVDTPGVGSLNLSHAEVTYGFLPNADLLLFVSDACAGLTETELAFLKQGYGHCKSILYPLTKMDLNADYREIMEDNRTKIANTLKLSEGEIIIVPISSKAKLRYLQTGDRDFYEASNYGQFENLIWSTVVQKRAEILLLPFLRLLRQEFIGMSESIAAQHQLLSTDRKKVYEMTATMNEQIADLEKNRRSNAEWRNRLGLDLTFIQNDINPMLKQQQLKLETYVKQTSANYGPKLVEERNYTKLFSEINSYVVQGLFEVRDIVDERLDEETRKLNGELGISMDVCKEALERINFVPPEAPEVCFPVHKKSEDLMRGGRAIGMDTMAGGRVGMIAGGIIGVGLALLAGPAVLAAAIGSSAMVAVGASAAAFAGIGTTEGGALGGTKGCISAIKNNRSVDIPIVMEAFRNHITTTYLRLNTVVANLLAEMRSELIRSFETQIADKERRIHETITQLSSTIKLSSAELPQKLQELKKKNEAVTSFVTMVDKFENQITQATETGPATLEADVKVQKESEAAASYDFLEM